MDLGYPIAARYHEQQIKTDFGWYNCAVYSSEMELDTRT